MTELGAVVVAAALVNNFVLVQFLGLCPFFGATGGYRQALGMAATTGVVLIVASLTGWLLEHWLLRPMGLTYLRLLLFVLTIATLVQAAETVLRARAPLLHAAAGIYLPLITSNCAILGGMLLITRDNDGFFMALAHATGVAVGFAGAVVVFAGLRERLLSPRIPKAMRGAPIALVTAGLMALGLAGLRGLA